MRLQEGGGVGHLLRPGRRLQHLPEQRVREQRDRRGDGFQRLGSEPALARRRRHGGRRAAGRSGLRRRGHRRCPRLLHGDGGGAAEAGQAEPCASSFEEPAQAPISAATTRNRRGLMPALCQGTPCPGVPKRMGPRGNIPSALAGASGCWPPAGPRTPSPARRRDPRWTTPSAAASGCSPAWCSCRSARRTCRRSPRRRGPATPFPSGSVIISRTSWAVTFASARVGSLSCIAVEEVARVALRRAGHVRQIGHADPLPAALSAVVPGAEVRLLREPVGEHQIERVWGSAPAGRPRGPGTPWRRSPRWTASESVRARSRGCGRGTSPATFPRTYWSATARYREPSRPGEEGVHPRHRVGRETRGLAPPDGDHGGLGNDRAPEVLQVVGRRRCGAGPGGHDRCVPARQRPPTPTDDGSRRSPAGGAQEPKQPVTLRLTPDDPGGRAQRKARPGRCCAPASDSTPRGGGRQAAPAEPREA